MGSLFAGIESNFLEAEQEEKEEVYCGVKVMGKINSNLEKKLQTF